MNDEGLADEPPLAPFVFPDFTQEVASARAQYEGPPKAAFGPHFLARRASNGSNDRPRNFSRRHERVSRGEVVETLSVDRVR
jgi:hypothetical protein